MERIRGFCDRETRMKYRLLKNISGKMRNLKKNQTVMGELIGINQSSFSNRMKDGKFDYIDLVKIFEELQFSSEEILEVMTEQKGEKQWN